MKMKHKYVECDCACDEHRIVFMREPNDTWIDMYVTVYLNHYRKWYKRIYIAIKYVFGYKCKYGDFDCTMLNKKDTQELGEWLINQ